MHSDVVGFFALQWSYHWRKVRPMTAEPTARKVRKMLIIGLPGAGKVTLNAPSAFRNVPLVAVFETMPAFGRSCSAVPPPG
jgi:hypothetical protein